jgi:hypothetical protein
MGFAPHPREPSCLSVPIHSRMSRSYDPTLQDGTRPFARYAWILSPAIREGVAAESKTPTHMNPFGLSQRVSIASSTCRSRASCKPVQRIISLLFAISQPILFYSGVPQCTRRQVQVIRNLRRNRPLPEDRHRSSENAQAPVPVLVASRYRHPELRSVSRGDYEPHLIGAHARLLERRHGLKKRRGSRAALT